jgi:hypothetical protein
MSITNIFILLSFLNNLIIHLSLIQFTRTQIKYLEIHLLLLLILIFDWTGYPFLNLQFRLQLACLKHH